MINPLYHLDRPHAMKNLKENEKISWPTKTQTNTLIPMISSTVIMDPISVELAQAFDYQWDGTTSFEPHKLPHIPTHYQLGLIVGPSGSGKSILLSHFGQPDPIDWLPNKSVASHFDSVQDAQNKLAAVGLNSIPVWMKPYQVLSTGEKFRADLARRLRSGAVIDEFTSVVDRHVALAASAAMRRHIDRHRLSHITIATCHYDVIRNLQPDWIYNTLTSVLDARGRVRRPRIHLEIYRCSYRAWKLFSRHHYLTANLHKQSQCYIALWDRIPVGFVAVLTFPHPIIKKASREHRLVIMPQFQGLGIGPRLSDSVAQLYIARGRKYYSRTAHPRLGYYRDNSNFWKPTNTNHRRQLPEKVITSISNHWQPDTSRICFSHQYIGHK